MKPSIPSPLHVQPDKISLPARFPLSVSRSKGVTPSFQRLHWHRALEINWITKGSGIYAINGREYPFERGDLFLIDSHDLHRAYEGKNLEMMIVMFEPSLLGGEQRYDPELLMPFRQTGAQFSNHIPHDHPSGERLAGYMEDMLREYEHEDASYISAIRGLLLLFLAEVNRKCRVEPDAHRNAETSSRHLEQIRAVIQAMDSGLQQAWTLKELADLAHLSPSRFSALFNRIVGTSPMNYLVQLRLEQAVRLLEQEELSVLEIAEASGFRNLSNFNRLFLHHIGTSPSVLRKKLRGEKLKEE